MGFYDQEPGQDLHPASGTVHHIVPCIRIVYSQRARHDSNMAELFIKVNRRLDPQYDLADKRRITAEGIRAKLCCHVGSDGI